MLEELDKRISTFTESVTRRISRRKALANTTKGLFATIAGIAFGELSNIKNAFASSCNCTGHICACGGNGLTCPSNCTTCTSSDWCNGYCDHPNGYWVSCSGLGRCGNGYYVCIDCKCPGCNNTCTCLAGCFCCNCCNHADVEAEMRRVAALLSAA